MPNNKSSGIANKIKRGDVYAQEKAAKAKAKSAARRKRKKDQEELGDAAPAPKKPATIESMREFDETVVEPNDEEVKGDEEIDEFSQFFNGEVKPKILVTTSPRATKVAFDFIRDLLHLIPNSFYYKRKGFEIQRICEAALAKDFTYVIIVHQDAKQLNHLLLLHLPEGPTAHFTIKNVKLTRDIPGHGRASRHKPEVILNNFNTRLGHRVGRMLGSVFHQEPQFHGRRVVTFHNQRDFIFVRHHRYYFDDSKTARIQELGPSFTLKLKYLQSGTYNTESGEYEYYHKV